MLTVGTRVSDPVDDERTCREAIAGSDWWTKAELEEHWPLSMDDAVQLLAEGAEFDIDADWLAELIARRIAPKPSINDAGDALEFNAFDVILAANVLEGRQQWRPTPSVHDPKKHPCQITLERARAAGEVESMIQPPAGVAQHDLTSLLAILGACDVREGRAKVIALLKIVLECEHGVFVP